MTEGQNTQPHPTNDAATHVEIFKAPQFDMKDLNVGKAFKDMVEVVKLNKTAMEQISKDERAATNAAFMVLAASLVSQLGAYVIGLAFGYQVGIVTYVLQAVYYAFGVLGGTYLLTYILTNFFKAKAVPARSFFNVVGISYGVMLLNIIAPVLGGLGSLVMGITGLWVLVVTIVAARKLFYNL